MVSIFLHYVLKATDGNCHILCQTTSNPIVNKNELPTETNLETQLLQQIFIEQPFKENSQFSIITLKGQNQKVTTYTAILERLKGNIT